MLKSKGVPFLAAAQAVRAPWGSAEDHRHGYSCALCAFMRWHCNSVELRTVVQYCVINKLLRVARSTSLAANIAAAINTVPAKLHVYRVLHVAAARGQTWN